MDLDDGRTPATSRRRRPSVGIDPLAIEPLAVYERNGDGHTLSRHCDRTPGADARRLAAEPGLLATGSFLSVAAAQRSTAACVDANRATVIDWLRGDHARLVIGHDMGEVIGSVLRRSRWLAGATQPRPATNVVTVLRRNHAYAAGFAVRTSYPVRREPVERPRPVPMEEGDVSQPYPARP